MALAENRLLAFELYINGGFVGYSQTNQLVIQEGFVTYFAGYEGNEAKAMKGTRLSDVFDWETIPVFSDAP